MRNFHVPINLDLNQRGSIKGAQDFWLMSFFVHSPLIHDIIYKNIGMRSMGGLRWDTLCT